jgi:methionine-rich copper-binding protein CopC
MEMRNVDVTRHFGQIAAVLALVLAPGTAFGHGETAETKPKDGAALARAPKQVSVDLTEPPTADAQFVVKDGCGATVSEAPSVDGTLLSAAIGKGEPGRWKVSYRIVSSVDGHPTRDGWSFIVDGKKDCSKDEPPSSTDPQDDAAPTTDPGDPDDDADEGSGFPVVPVVGGTLALVAVAFVIRTRSEG